MLQTERFKLHLFSNMNLIIIRHAKAEDFGKFPTGDSGRELVEKGKQQAKSVAAFLEKHDLIPELILTSPILRALQTAEIISDRLKLAQPTKESWLASGMLPEVAIRELVAYKELSRVAIVGHEPDLSELIGWICGMDPKNYIEIKKASVTSLTFEPNKKGAVLHFSIPPKMM